MTISQILECNSAIQQAIEEKYEGSGTKNVDIKIEEILGINSKQFKNGGSPYMNNAPIIDFPDPSDEDMKEIEKIKKVLENMIKKINDLEKKHDKGK